MISPTAANPAADDAPVLVGREREQALLARHLASALAGRGSLVLVGGEAGIGKTALAEALATDAASQGALVLVGRCYDLSETAPYGPWVEASSSSVRVAFPTFLSESDGDCDFRCSAFVPAPETATGCTAG